ncbi:MAG: 6-phosphogluconolactonase [Acidisphaera sp.]|nr:6-phosphogluconolactonase [Acidisphaera sp.]MBV9812403.1 6-phosphogluconolactonase [Acetobacteraceae bacterium]
MSDLQVLPDPEALAQHAASWIVEQAEASSGRFAWNLSGGSTPKRLYQLLAAPPFRERMPWSRVHVFWGDERFVPHDHPESNFRMTREAMLEHVPIPAANIHPIAGEGDPDDAAGAYEATLKRFYGADALDAARPLFDVTLLGLGDDGHTASLIPGTSALGEQRAWVTAVRGGRPEVRITMTYPVLDSSRVVAFLVAGDAKRTMLARVRSGDRSLPAGRIAPVGSLLFLADQAAAGSA